ncbi:single-stranded DNA-binding protein [Microbacterium sp. YY-01]|uniref:single-stranded DNA-binding protein n=1 Tax=Microbacterium sp. YY-01 TaxID=3421634 RepID=UPI003D166052
MTDMITLTGNIANEPAVNRTGAGTPLVRFRLATSNGYRDNRTGAWVDAGTNWYTVTAFRTLAENAGGVLAKGDAVIVQGRLRLREWEANGATGLAVDVEATTIGHDLRWGTSGTYQRRRRTENTSDHNQEPQENTPTSTDTDTTQHQQPDATAEWPVALAAEATPF